MPSVSWTHEFSHPTEKVWDLISNTDRVNRQIGLPPVEFYSQPNSNGGSTLFGKLKLFGFLLHWIEHPHEWVLHQYFRVERTYQSGAIKKMTVQWKFLPTEQGSIVYQTIDYEVSCWFYVPFVKFLLSKKLGPSFVKYYSRLNKELAGSPLKQSRRTLRRILVSSRKFKKLREKMALAKVDPLEMKLLFKWLFSSHDLELDRIRPFQMAKVWNKQRDIVLSNFLKATQIGIFQLSWDIICQNCRCVKSKVSSLSDLKDDAYCDTCNLRIGIDFSRSVEVSFRPNPEFRLIKSKKYCVGGPQNTPHCLSQVRLAPGERKIVTTRLPDGEFRIRSLHSSEVIYINNHKTTGTSQKNTIEVVFKLKEKTDPEIYRIQGDEIVLHIKNEHLYEVVLILERTAWIEDACTGTLITTLQEFKNLFSSHVLKSGKEIKISGVALLFTDIKSSTNLYQKLGDSAAFVIINQHLEVLSKCVYRQQGTVVKTIGDSVMAAFLQPDDAIKAAIEMQKSIAQMNFQKAFIEQISLKIGAHFGPCFIVSRTDQLDYFGTTVNIAARVAGECEGDDIVITGKMIDDPGVKAVLKSYRLTAVQNVRSLKGLNEEFELYRILPLKSNH